MTVSPRWQALFSTTALKQQFMACPLLIRYPLESEPEHQLGKTEWQTPQEYNFQEILSLWLGKIILYEYWLLKKLNLKVL